MVMGAILHPVLTPGPQVARAAVIGFVIGFLAWVFHKLVLKRVEDRFGVRLEEDDATQVPIKYKDDYKP